MKNIRRMIPVIGFSLMVALTAAGCVYYNMFFNAKKKFELAEKQSQQGVGSQRIGRYGVGYRGYEEAIEHFSRVIERHPNSKWVDDAYYYIGLSYFRMADYDKAERAFREILDNHPKSKYVEEATFWIALSRVHSGEVAAGRTMLRKLAHSGEKKVWRASALYELGEVFFRDEEYDSAATAYLTVANDYPGVEENGDARYKAGEALILSGNSEEALKQFRQTLKESPTEDLIYRTRVRMADAYFDFGQIDSGLVLLRALAKNDVYFDSLGVLQLNIGEGLEKAGRFDEAIETYEDVTATFPKSTWSAEAYYRIGYIHQKEFFDFPAAREFYQKSKDEYARSEYARKAINLSVTLATIEGYQQQIAEYLLGADTAAAADSNGTIDTTASADTMPAADTSGAIEPTATAGMSAEADSAAAFMGMEPDTGIPSEQATENDSMFTADTVRGESDLSNVDSLPVPSVPQAGENVVARDSLEQPPADTSTAKRIENTDIYSSEMPSVDTTLVIDTTLVFDTLLVLDTVMALDADLVFALQGPVGEESLWAVTDSGGPPSAIHSFVGEPLMTSDSLPPGERLESADSLVEVDTLSDMEVPPAVDTVVNLDTVIQIDTTAPAHAEVVDTSGVIDSTIVEEPEKPRRVATVVDTMLLIDTVLSLDTTLAFDSVFVDAGLSAVDTALAVDTVAVAGQGAAADTELAVEPEGTAVQMPLVDTTQVIDTTFRVDTTLAFVSVRPTATAPAYGSMLVVDTTEVVDSMWVVDTTLVVDRAALTAYEKKKAAREKVATAYFKLAEAFHMTLGVPDSALYYYDSLVVKFPESDHVPRALFAAGAILEDELQDTVGAFERYRAILGKYGRTDFAGAAIERLGLSGTAIDTGYPAAYFRDAERLYLEENRPDSAQALFASIAQEFPTSYYAPKAAYASVVVAGQSHPREDSSLYRLYKEFIDNFPGTPYAAAAKDMLGSETSTGGTQRRRAVIEQKRGTEGVDSAMQAIQDEQSDTTIIQYPWAPKPKVAGIFNYPESEMDTDPYQGRVVFKIWIDFTGQIAEYEMVESSDLPDIDLAAQQAVEQTIFDPDSIAPESLNMWYRYEVKVIPRAQQPDNLFNDPLFKTD